MLFRAPAGYLPLSITPSQSKIGEPNIRWFNKRLFRFVVLALAFLGFVVWYLTRPKPPQLPPLYEDYKYREDHLAHYDPDSPYPNGEHAKYILFGNHQQGVGFGNVLQEFIVNAFLAWKLKRAHVFYNYQWRRNEPYAEYNGHLIPAQVPMSVILSGPLVGGHIVEPYDVPRAVSQNHFREVCANRTTIIRGETIKEPLQGKPAVEIFNGTLERFRQMEDRCIEIADESMSIFDFSIFGEKHILGLWDELSKSPMITQFDFSPLIHAAFKSNLNLFVPSSAIPAILSETGNPLFRRLPGLVVLHLRRGDYVGHCDHLARWSANWNGFNQADGLPDRFSPPPGGGNTPEGLAIYRKHCYPTIDDIVKKVADVRKKVPELSRLYIMTNGKPEWINELKQALHQAPETWDGIMSSRDLTLNWEQKFVSHALDMLVAQRAQVLIGNGWSSLTSNTVMLRIAGKQEMNTTYFW